ncbi:MAG: PEP-CTERM sorting domain-containing protein [Acidobacteriia bacterium]|nr:PEP-CTERM sorting domain-containing protein [Terriglobia bacterium]
MSKSRLAAGLVLAAGVLGVPAAISAATLSGTFNLDGTITVTGNTITWQDNAAVPNKATIAATGATGSFAGLGNTEVTIQNLVNPPDVVGGAGFAATPFISFDANPALPVLDINFIFPGPYSSAACSAAPAPGQTCTPSNPGGSPFGLSNLGSGGVVTGSTAAFAFSGVTSDGLSTWKGNFTSQFNDPYQTVLAGLATNGSVTNTYSGTFLVSVTPRVPEPSTYMLVLGSLGALFALRKKRAARLS